MWKTIAELQRKMLQLLEKIEVLTLQINRLETVLEEIKQEIEFSDMKE